MLDSTGQYVNFVHVRCQMLCMHNNYVVNVHLHDCIALFVYMYDCSVEYIKFYLIILQDLLLIIDRISIIELLVKGY